MTNRPELFLGHTGRNKGRKEKEWMRGKGRKERERENVANCFLWPILNEDRNFRVVFILLLLPVFPFSPSCSSEGTKETLKGVFSPYIISAAFLSVFRGSSSFFLIRHCSSLSFVLTCILSEKSLHSPRSNWPGSIGTKLFLLIAICGTRCTALIM